MDVSGVVYVCDLRNNRILVSMTLYRHCYSEFNVSPHMYYFSLYVSTLL